MEKHQIIIELDIDPNQATPLNVTLTCSDGLKVFPTLEALESNFIVLKSAAYDIVRNEYSGPRDGAEHFFQSISVHQAMKAIRMNNDPDISIVQM